MRTLLAVLIAIVFIAIAEYIPPSARTFDGVIGSIPANESWHLGGVQSTPWHSGECQVFEAWWTIDVDGLPTSYTANHMVVLPPASTKITAMPWMAVPLSRLWILIAGLVLSLAIFLALTRRATSGDEEMVPDTSAHECPRPITGKPGDPSRVMPALRDR